MLALNAPTEPAPQQSGPPGALYVYVVTYEGGSAVDLHASHELEEVAPAGESVLMGQGVHAAARAPAKVPGAHCVHAVAPAPAAYPAVHAVHALDSVGAA